MSGIRALAKAGSICSIVTASCLMRNSTSGDVEALGLKRLVRRVDGIPEMPVVDERVQLVHGNNAIHVLIFSEVEINFAKSPLLPPHPSARAERQKPKSNNGIAATKAKLYPLPELH